MILWNNDMGMGLVTFGFKDVVQEGSNLPLTRQHASEVDIW